MLSFCVCFVIIGFLELSQSAFKDALPTELGLLTDLQFLNLEGNYFSGTIPTELGKLELLGT
jgi:hypothetical protein